MTQDSKRVPPGDFRQFWEKTLLELEAISAKVQTRKLDSPNKDCDLLEISFDSFGGVRIYGYLIQWKGGDPRPLVIHSHGYESSCEPQWQWAERGVNVLGVDIRGCGKSSGALPTQSRWGYVLTGIEQPETHVLRGAVCDYIRAVEAAREFFGSRVTNIVVHGFSFSGALAIMAEATLDVADVLAIGVPTFGWGEGRLFFTQAGSGAEVAKYVAAHEESAEDVMLVLRYFDPIHFADSVTCPVVAGLGLFDPVVPAQTVRPILRHLNVPYELMEFPCSHTIRPEEKEWGRFDLRWIELAQKGIPAGFGQKK